MNTLYSIFINFPDSISIFFMSLFKPVRNVLTWIKSKYFHETIFFENEIFAFGLVGRYNKAWRFRLAKYYCDNEQPVFNINSRVHISTRKYAQDAALKHGLVILSGGGINNFNHEYLEFPLFVSSYVDLLKSEEVFLSKLPASALDDLRKIRANKLTFEICSDIDWINEFYFCYHKPSIELRHGEVGYVWPLHKIKQIMSRGAGEFIIISSFGQRIGAVLNETKNNNYYLRCIGWLNGDAVLRKSGLIAALYWYSMQRARQLGLNGVHLGGSPSCVEDGLLQYKSKWSASLTQVETRQISKKSFLLLNPTHQATRRLLKKYSLIVLNSHGDFIVISAKHSRDVKLPPTLAKSITKWYCLLDNPSLNSEICNSDLPLALRNWFHEETI